MEITDANLATWKELCDKATPGPWTYGRNWSVVGPGHDWERCRAGHPEYDVRVCYIMGPAGNNNRADGDFDFIVAARTAMPALLAEVERLRDKYERGRTVLISGVNPTS